MGRDQLLPDRAAGLKVREASCYRGVLRAGGVHSRGHLCQSLSGRSRGSQQFASIDACSLDAGVQLVEVGEQLSLLLLGGFRLPRDRAQVGHLRGKEDALGVRVRHRHFRAALSLGDQPLRQAAHGSLGRPGYLNGCFDARLGESELVLPHVVLAKIRRVRMLGRSAHRAGLSGHELLGKNTRVTVELSPPEVVAGRGGVGELAAGSQRFGARGVEIAGKLLCSLRRAVTVGGLSRSQPCHRQRTGLQHERLHSVGQNSRLVSRRDAPRLVLPNLLVMCLQIALKPVARHPQVGEAAFVLKDALQETDLVAEVLDRARHLSGVGGQAGPHREVGALRLFGLLPVPSQRLDGLPPSQYGLNSQLRPAGRVKALAIGAH